MKRQKNLLRTSERVKRYLIGGTYLYGVYSYRKILSKNNSLKYVSDSPFNLIYVDPSKIKYNQEPSAHPEIALDSKKRPHKIKNINKVVGRSWDKKTSKLEEEMLYKAFVDRFKNGKDWKQTKFIQKQLEKIKNGDKAWRSCKTEKEIFDRCREIDNLYKSIKENSYRLRREERNTWTRKIDELTVNIGRNGEII